MDLFGVCRTHTADRLELLDARLLQPVDRSEVLGEQAGHRPADVSDAERNQKAQQRCRLAGFDPVKQVLGGLVRKALEGQELRLAQVIEVGRVFDQLPVDQLLQRGVAETLDVEGADEVSQVLQHLRGADWIDAAGRCFSGLPHQVGPALRTFLRHVPGAARRGPLLFQDADHFGDDVTGALDDDVVRRPDILARHLVLVVEGGAADGDTADLDRRQPGDRGDGAGAADVDLDVLHDGLGLLGWELEGQRPARAA